MSNTRIDLQAILFPGRRKVEQGWRGEGAPRPRAAAWRRARPGKSSDRTPPEIGLTPEKELLTIDLLAETRKNYLPLLFAVSFFPQSADRAFKEPSITKTIGSMGIVSPYSLKYDIKEIR